MPATPDDSTPTNDDAAEHTVLADRPAGPLKLGVLVSGGGTTMDNLAQRIAAGTLDTAIVQVVVSNDRAGAIALAERLGLPCQVLRRKDHDSTDAYSDAVFSVLRERGVELVCLAGFLSLLRIPDDYAWRVVNIHPSLLPSFGGKGMYGRHVHVAVLTAGAKVSGCTVHFADNTYDTGPILAQRACPVRPGDTAEALAARVFEQECALYPEVLAALAAGRVRRRGGHAWIEDA